MRLSFSHLSVRNRLLAGFATVLLLLVVLAVTGADRVNRIDDRLTQINDVNGLMIRHAIDLSHSVNERAMLLRDISLLSDPFEIEGRVERYAALREQYAAAAQRMTATIERFPEVVSAEDLALV
ncbi:MAG: MCP four helix bundle domain-containing protein, partial [Billgrantia desiderata]